MTYSCIDDATVKLFADHTHLFDNGQSIDEVSAITNICICMSRVRGNRKGKSLHGELTNGKPAGMSYTPFSIGFRSRQFPGPEYIQRSIVLLVTSRCPMWYAMCDRFQCWSQ